MVNIRNSNSGIYAVTGNPVVNYKVIACFTRYRYTIAVPCDFGINAGVLVCKEELVFLSIANT